MPPPARASWVSGSLAWLWVCLVIPQPLGIPFVRTSARASGSIDVLFVGLLVWHGSRWWTPRALAISACLGAVSLGVGSFEAGVGLGLVATIVPLSLLWPLAIAEMVLDSARQTRAADRPLLQPVHAPDSNTPTPSRDLVGTGMAVVVAVTCIMLTAAGFAGSLPSKTPHGFSWRWLLPAQ